MGRNNPKLMTTYSILTEEVLLDFCEKFHIPANYHPVVPNANVCIMGFPEGKVGVYTRFFEFCNYRVPMSLLLSELLAFYNLHISQLSVLGAAKASHFEISCRAHGIIPTVPLFRVFYIPHLQDGWVSFVKRRGRDVPQLYSKRLESVKDWKDRFFWIDERFLGFPVAWHDEQFDERYTDMPGADTYSQLDVETLATHQTEINRLPEELLCVVGLSRNYTLGDDLYPTFSHNDRGENLISL